MTDYGYVDVGKLADFANNTIGGLTANDIMRFPRANVQPVKWISVKDRLPEEADVDVLVWIEHGTADGVEFYDSLHIAHWYGDDKVFADLKDDEVKGVTHWMYRSAILEPPKDGDK